MKKLFWSLHLPLLLAVNGLLANAPAPIPESVLEKEIEAHRRQQIPTDQVVKPLQYSEISQRVPKLLFEHFNERPQDIFFINYKGCKFVGRKLISNLYLDHKILGTKCSRITAPMILGVFQREQILSDGIMVFYHPLESGEKLALFNELKGAPLADLYFPYPYLDSQRQAAIWPIEFWNASAEFVDNLDAGEVAFRKCIIQWLSQFDLTDKVLYDPSCSTGRFLSEIKKHYPKAYTIGQDISEPMVKYAKANSLIDKVYSGDSLESPVKEGSVDFIFFRFLNLEVVTVDQAAHLFSKIANRCRDGGYLIVFGHTPVLLSAEWFKILGLEVLQSIGYNEEEPSIFQFYILRKHQAVPSIPFEEHTFL